MTKDTGGPAFPRPVSGNPDHDGMTLRDWFAGQALSAAYQNGGRYGEEGLAAVARVSYAMADAMLAERSTP